MRGLIRFDRHEYWLDFDLDLSGSTNKCFNALERQIHDGIRMIALTSFVQKIFVKNLHVFTARPLWSLASPQMSTSGLNF